MDQFLKENINSTTYLYIGPDCIESTTYVENNKHSSRACYFAKYSKKGAIFLNRHRQSGLILLFSK